MENRKQLIIIPPMSEPMQKLHEVLNGIVDDENIEITLIDESREFNQFVGSSGQCLAVFSNPKLCVTYLQENRAAVAKTHSKIILLTPKEIPAKTLVKFVKLGLTEAILDNSPPKTLLYKVKLLLRSIKSTSSPQEDKNRVVKSSQDAAQAPTEQNDLPAYKNDNDSETLNPTAEEKSKKFKNDEENVIDYGGRLKGKNKYQEETIETNWTSKRKTDSVDSNGDDSPNQKVKIEDSDDIDMYYRNKNKKNLSVNLEEAELPEKKSKREDEESVDDYGRKKQSDLNIELEAAATEGKKRGYQEEPEDPLFVKKNSDAIDLLGADETPEEKRLNEEEIELSRKKELAELDALIEAAKKKQAESESAEDLGGHYKGKIDTAKLDLEEADEDDKEKKEYDNSELSQKEKKIDLILEEVALERNRRQIQEEDNDDENASHDGEVDNINNDMVGEDGASDRINTLMMSDIREDSSKNILSELDIESSKAKKQEEDSLESLEDTKKKTALELLDGDADNANQKDNVEEEFELDPYKKEKQELEISTEELSRKSVTNEDEENEDGQNKKAAVTNLQFADGDNDRAKSSLQNEESDIALKKLKNSELDLDGGNEGERPSSKVDQIDSYYRSGDAKKVEHSWDNLTSKTNSLNLNIEKASRGEDEQGSILPKKDLGEITIDYRKLKEEFDYIAKHGANGEEVSINERSARAINDSDDEGTFKVIETDARGFEFGIEMINLIYQKDSKAVDFYKKVSEELISQYKAYSVFYTFKVSENKHTEAFDSFMYFGDALVSTELKEWWFNAKTEKSVFDHYFEKTMITWLCRDIQNKSGDGNFWEDVELPSWAANELTDKKVEMIFPYFDGVDRMGVAVLIFPNGVNPAKEKSIMVTLEMVRTILLESIQRKLSPVDDKLKNDDEPVTEKKNIMSMFSGLFNRNKAG